MPSPTGPAPIKAIGVERSVIASDPPQATHTIVLGMSPESEEGGKSEPEKSGQFDFDLIPAGTLRAVERVVRLPHQQGEFRRLLALESGDPEASRHRNNRAAK